MFNEEKIKMTVFRYYPKKYMLNPICITYYTHLKEIMLITYGERMIEEIYIKWTSLLAIRKTKTN